MYLQQLIKMIKMTIFSRRAVSTTIKKFQNLLAQLKYSMVLGALMYFNSSSKESLKATRGNTHKQIFK